MSIEKDAQRVANAYLKAETRMLERITAALAKGIDASDWDRQALGRLQRLRAESFDDLDRTGNIMAKYMRQHVADAYAAGYATQLRDVGADVDPLRVATLQRKQMVKQLGHEIVEGVTDATNAVLRQHDDAFRWIVADVVERTAVQDITRREAVQIALRDMFKKGMTFKDKAGKQWQLADYANMAVRTGNAQASIRGHEAALDDAGLDLVIVHPGPRSCRICDKWARVILARNGQPGKQIVKNALNGYRATVNVEATLDQARADGFQHPNCRCSIRGYIPGVTNKDVIKRPPFDAEGYAAQQKQRSIENNIRSAKTQQAIAFTPAEKQKAAAKIAAQQKLMREHMAANPTLKRQSAREQITDLNKPPSDPTPKQPKLPPVVPVPKVDAPKAKRTTKPKAKPAADDLGGMPARFASVKRIGAPASMLQHARVTNPGHAINAEYQNNCSFVVNAVELRARGFDVIARPIPGATGRFPSVIAADWIDPKTGSTRPFTNISLSTGMSSRVKSIEKGVEAAVADWPVGARGYVLGSWRTRGAHIFNIERTADGFELHEGQIAGVEGARVRDYLKEIKPASADILRVDDLVPKDADVMLDKIVMEATPDNMAKFSAENAEANRQSRLDSMQAEIVEKRILELAQDIQRRESDLRERGATMTPEQISKAKSMIAATRMRMRTEQMKADRLRRR